MSHQQCHTVVIPYRKENSTIQKEKILYCVYVHLLENVVCALQTHINSMKQKFNVAYTVENDIIKYKIVQAQIQTLTSQIATIVPGYKPKQMAIRSYVPVTSTVATDHVPSTLTKPWDDTATTMTTPYPTTTTTTICYKINNNVTCSLKRKRTSLDIGDDSKVTNNSESAQGFSHQTEDQYHNTTNSNQIIHNKTIEQNRKKLKQLRHKSKLLATYNKRIKQEHEDASTNKSREKHTTAKRHFITATTLESNDEQPPEETVVDQGIWRHENQYLHFKPSTYLSSKGISNNRGLFAKTTMPQIIRKGQCFARYRGAIKTVAQADQDPLNKYAMEYVHPETGEITHVVDATGYCENPAMWINSVDPGDEKLINCRFVAYPDEDPEYPFVMATRDIYPGDEILAFYVYPVDEYDYEQDGHPDEISERIN